MEKKKIENGETMEAKSLQKNIQNMRMTLTNYAILVSITDK
jgi:hypothetical protein